MHFPFLGSPYCFYLGAVIVQVVHAVIYIECGPKNFAAAGGYVICNFFICGLLFGYAISLSANADFSRRLAYICITLATTFGLFFGIPLAMWIYGSWETWTYFLSVWTIALLVLPVQDVVIIGLCIKRLPLWRFMTRSSQAIDRREEAEAHELDSTYDI